MRKPPATSFVLTLLLLSPTAVCAQTGASSVTIRGQVSAAVSVSADEARAQGDGAQVSIAEVDASTIAVTISGSGTGRARVRLPVKLRSNVGYALMASNVSTGGTGLRLSVADVKATGKFVHANALEARRPEPSSSLTLQDRARPVEILSGPPVSKAGTFTSPDNAIEVLLSVEIPPRADRGDWSAILTISSVPSR